MQSLTFLQALKVWWGHAWRNFVLGIPVMIVFLGVSILSTKSFAPEPGKPPKFPVALFAVFPVFWLAMIAIQVLAMRWTLKTRWSDFHLEVKLHNESEQNQA